MVEELTCELFKILIKAKWTTRVSETLIVEKSTWLDEDDDENEEEEVVEETHPHRA